MNQEFAEAFMIEAIMEGRKARSICSPNPPVGCVLVSSNKVIARGFTNEPGRPHAEAMALNQLESVDSPVTAFVTLEPCSFHGRTPSCAKDLIKRKIESVYIGIIDPDPRNNGKAVKLLREAGIKVNVGVMSETIQNELGPYLCKQHIIKT